MSIKKRRLWIITELFPPDETSTSYILGEIANAMTKKYDVRVICGPEIYDKRKKIDSEHKFVLDASIDVTRVRGADLDKNTTRGKALSFLLMSKRLYALAKSSIEKEDKVLMVTNPAPLILLMSRLKKRREFEWHILIHDIFPENTKPAGVRLPLYGFVKSMFDHAYSVADQLIVLGRDMAEILEKKVAKAKRKPKIRIIENWADVEAVTPQPMPRGKIILEYAGNIGRVQGLDKVITQMPDDIELHIYGTGAMECFLKEMKQPNVYFHGPYFRRQQNEVLAACHIALVTLQEGMYGLGVPSKTYNILASGRPILFFGPRDSEIYRLVRDKGIGFVEWPKVWNKDDLEEKGKKARVLAEKEYSKPIILQKFVDSI